MAALRSGLIEDKFWKDRIAFIFKGQSVQEE
jgi:hypothetical protein